MSNLPFGDFEEPREVEASHLVRSRCVTCGADALCVPERARVALCGTCRAAPAAPELLGLYVPAVGYPTGTNRNPNPQVEVEGFPQAAVSSRSGIAPPMGVHRAVLELRGLAIADGWRVVTQYARGFKQHAKTGRPLGEWHSIALRFGLRPGRTDMAYALYMTPVSKISWTWESVWTWGPELTPREINVTTLKKWLIHG